MHLFLNLTASLSHQDLSINKSKRTGVIILRWSYGTFAAETRQFISFCPFQDLNPSSCHTTITIINRRHQIGSNHHPAVNNQSFSGLIWEDKTGNQNFEANTHEGTGVHITINNLMGESPKIEATASPIGGLSFRGLHTLLLSTDREFWALSSTRGKYSPSVIWII